MVQRCAENLVRSGGKQKLYARPLEERSIWGWEKNSASKVLDGKHDDFCSISSIHGKMTGLVTGSYPSTGGGETVGYLSLIGQPAYSTWQVSYKTRWMAPEL